MDSMSARSTATSASNRASAARSAGATRASRATGVGKGLSDTLGGLKQELLKPAKRPKLLAGAAFAAYMTLLFVSIAVWWGLSNVMDQGWAALIVACVWAIVCTVLYVASKRPSAIRPS